MKIELYDNLEGYTPEEREEYIFVNGRELDIEDLILEIKSRFKLDIDYKKIHFDRVVELLRGKDGS